jgi:hypothetical protein
MAGPRALRLRSFAKVNLGLEVLGLRDDGYHELRTLFQTIDLHDDVVLRPRSRGVVVRCNHPLVPTDATNLAANGSRSGGGSAAGRATRRPCSWGSTACGGWGWALPASTGWPDVWAPTCPTSSSGAPPWACPGETRSTPCAARSAPTPWS